MTPLRLGIVGLDTSHVAAFTELLHDASNPHHVPGARVVAAFSGDMSGFFLNVEQESRTREILVQKHGVEMVGSIASLKNRVDGLLIESTDGRAHAEQFSLVADWGVPVFIDKPLAASSGDAERIAALAKKHGTRVMSSSALRYAEALCEALKPDAADADGPIIGGDFYGPMPLREPSAGLFWYGIHSIEMLFTAMGDDWVSVRAERHGTQDLIVARRADGGLGTVRGNRTGNDEFGGVIHRPKRRRSFDVTAGKTPFYASLLARMIPFLAGDEASVSLAESVRMIRFIEAANRSIETGGEPVSLVP